MEPEYEANPIFEEILQQLLEDFPELLSTGMIQEVEKHRWLLIEREVGIPSEERASDRWYLDHLFLDQYAIPTLVEVKGFTNTQIRREVIGQMIDYAANAIKYWPPEIIQEKFTAICIIKGDDPLDKIDELLNSQGRESELFNEYWDNVKGNLKEGKIRIVFFADKIPTELKNAVEFLQKQFSRADVWAVEIGKFIRKNPSVIDNYYQRIIARKNRRKSPDFDVLYRIAEGQAGYFTPGQAQEAGYSRERLSDLTARGRFQRIAHGVYRLAHFPASAYEDLFIAWLRVGPNSVVSHESALGLYELSDVMPSEIHIIMPRTGSRRREGLRLHTNKLNDDEITYRQGLPVTTVARTIRDVIQSGLSREFVEQAIREALQRGLTTREELVKQASRSSRRVAEIMQKVLV